MVSNYMVRNEDEGHWGPIFRSYLTKSVESQLMLLLDLLSQQSFRGIGEDSMIWVPSKEFLFSHGLFLSVLVERVSDG